MKDIFLQGQVIGPGKEGRTRVLNEAGKECATG